MESHNVSCEPMDIDLSVNSVKEMDISFNDYQAVSEDVIFGQNIIKTEEIHPVERLSVGASLQPTVKKYHINLTKPQKSNKNTVLKILSAVIIALVSVIVYEMYTLKCCDDFHIKNLSETLKNKLFGQSEAIDVIVKTLELQDSSKILFFLGGTGVGKTFVSSLILEYIGTCSNTYHYMMPGFANSFSSEYMFGLTMCKNALLIVDDLSVNDMEIKSKVNSVIEKSKSLAKDIVVILIFNCYESKDLVKECDEALSLELLRRYDDVNALKRVVRFEPLNEKHLQKCIENELGDRLFDKSRLTEILKNFNVTTDGCKGVHSKMKYLSVV